MRARQGFASGIAALGVALMLAPAASWSSDPGSAPAAASSSAPAHTPHRRPRHGALRIAHPAPPQSSTAGNSKAASGNRLALQAPPLNHIIEQRQLRYILAYNGDEDGDTDVQSVSVETTVPSVMVPMGQLYALPWAFLHPTQAWRIFAPVPQQ